ncbi:MAG: hypothetical protein M3068_02150 [Gemmatimonadota bacterium]|nr:hypothetical protein [Gemmatimonadota bacterium]
MYSTCLFCNTKLGANDAVPSFSVGQRLAFDAERGRLWVICPHCRRWNLSPIEERWEAVEECERLFRDTTTRVFRENIGLAQRPDGLDLVRIGKALATELAAWRYGRQLTRRLPPRAGSSLRALSGDSMLRAGRALDRLLRWMPRIHIPYDAATWVRVHRSPRRILDVIRTEGGGETPAVIRQMHLESATLLRPARDLPWRLLVAHDGGFATLEGATGLRTAGRLLAAINGSGGSDEQVQQAVAKVADAGNPTGYFARVASIAMRTSWGRFPDAADRPEIVSGEMRDRERVALHITSRSFWGRGAIGSEPATALPRLPLVDRIALEMAANEDAERRALEGELAELLAAWRDAEEIAAISDGLLSLRAAAGWREWLLASRAAFMH